MTTDTPKHHPTFEIETTRCDEEYLSVLVSKARVLIKRESEGIVVDIYNIKGGDPIASTYAFDHEFETN